MATAVDTSKQEVSGDNVESSPAPLPPSSVSVSQNSSKSSAGALVSSSPSVVFSPSPKQPSHVDHPPRCATTSLSSFPSSHSPSSPYLHSSSSSAHRSVIIVGGGPVGCLQAIYLARRGYPVDLYEQRDDIRKYKNNSGRSINIALSERGRCALRCVGLEEIILSNAVRVYSRFIHKTDRNGGVETYEIPYGENNEYNNSINRNDVNAHLLNEAERYENVRLHFNHHLIRIDGRTTTCYFEDILTKKIVKKKHAFVFGCDGIFSTVRSQMTKFRPTDLLFQSYDLSYKELQLGVDERGGPLLKKHHLHIWPRGDKMLIGLPNADNTFTLTLFGETQFFEYFDTKLRHHGRHHHSRHKHSHLHLSHSHRYGSNSSSILDQQSNERSDAHEYAEKPNYFEYVNNNNDSRSLCEYSTTSNDIDCHSVTSKQSTSHTPLRSSIASRGVHDVCSQKDGVQSHCNDTVDTTDKNAGLGNEESSAVPVEGAEEDDELENKRRKVEQQRREQLQDFFTLNFPDLVEVAGLERLVDQFEKNPSGYLSTCSISHYYSNNICLMGDAAHAILPFYGQGMNCGFEDCRVFAEFLDATQNIKHAAKLFSESRKIDADSIAELSRENYLEMRQKVSSRFFILRKRIDSFFYRAFPLFWIPQYSMVSYTTIRYSDVIKRRNIQSKIVNMFIFLSSAFCTLTVSTAAFFILRKCLFSKK